VQILSCPPNEKVFINNITYESRALNDCNGLVSCQQTFTDHSIHLSHVQSQCNYQNQCSPNILPLYKCQNSTKKIVSVTINFDCISYTNNNTKRKFLAKKLFHMSFFIFPFIHVARYYSKVLCKTEFYTLNCFPGHQISIMSVLYGAHIGSNCTTNTTCVEGGNDELSDYCNGKNTCSFSMRPKFLRECQLDSNVYQLSYYCEAGMGCLF
jgi:hypothetical protein